eukprot:3052144-Lingulodinium_polyedra.AAC.1
MLLFSPREVARHPHATVFGSSFPAEPALAAQPEPAASQLHLGAIEDRSESSEVGDNLDAGASDAYSEFKQ